jgi:hypothetical protein
MPTVPRYGEQHVETRPLPGVRGPTNLPAGAAGVATDFGLERGLDSVERAFGQLYEREVEKANKVALTGAAARLAELETRIMYDPKQGVLNMRGARSLEGKKFLDDEWTKGTGEIEGGLATENQRLAFRQSVAERTPSLHRALTQHTASEMEKYDAEQTNALLTNETNAATAAAIKGVSFLNAADRATQSIERQRIAVKEFAERRGLPPEQAKVMMERTTSGTHAAVIEQMAANNDDMTAKQYFDEFKDQLVGDDLTKMTKLVQDGSLRGEAQRQSDLIVGKYKDNRDAAMEAIKKIKNPELRDKTREYVINEYNVQDAIERDKREKNYLDAANIIEPFVKSGKPFLAQDVVPENLWGKLTLEQRNALGRRAGDRENDYRAFHEFIDMTPQEMGKLNRDQFETMYWSKFDNANRTRAEAMWAAARDGVRTGRFDPKTTADITFKDQVNMTLQKLGFVPRNEAPSKYNERQYQLWADFYAAATFEKDKREAAKGKPLTSEEIQGVINETARRVWYDDGGWLGRESRKLVAAPVERDDNNRTKVSYNNIPADQVEQARIAIRGARKTSTRSKIERLYAAAVLGDKKLWDDILKEP